MVTYQVLVAACKVAEVRRARAASQTAAFRLRQRALNCGLTLCASKVAIAVYVLSGHDAFVATRFMIQKLKLPTDHDTAEFATWVESKYLETHLDALVAYELPESDAERRIHTHRRASSFRRSALLFTLSVPILIRALHLVGGRLQKNISAIVIRLER